MIVIGIDPGLANTGYGIVRQKTARDKTTIECIEYGLIQTTPDNILPDRLKKLNNDLSKLIGEFRPDALILENLYFFKNLKTIIPVSQAQGVILLAAAKKRMPVYRFTPLEVKMAITGFGRAEKKDIQKKITEILSLKETPKPDDVADALSVAVTYFFKNS